jgi:hypothetical protein
MISPLASAGLILVAVISPDSPPLTIGAVGLFVAALCYVLARVADDIQAHRNDLADLAKQAHHHRETLAKQLYGGIAHEALTWIGAHDRQVERFENAASTLHATYGPPSDGLARLRAVRSPGRDARRVNPSA